jgi:ankyrin repeat protein
MSIFEAVKCNDVESVSQYLKNKGNPSVYEDWSTKISLLHLAISHHNDGVAMMLIDYGADIFAEDKLHQQTSIAMAVEKGAHRLLHYMCSRIKREL